MVRSARHLIEVPRTQTDLSLISNSDELNDEAMDSGGEENEYGRSRLSVRQLVARVLT